MYNCVMNHYTARTQIIFANWQILAFCVVSIYRGQRQCLADNLIMDEDARLHGNCSFLDFVSFALPVEHTSSGRNRIFMKLYVRAKVQK